MKSEAKLSRRVLFKALSMGIAAPLAFRFSQLALAQPTRPKRLILYYFPHGVANEHLDMEPYLMPSNPLFKDYGADPKSPKGGVHVAADYTLNTRTGFNMLESLAPYRSQLSVIRGLYQSGEFGTHDSIKCILTGNGQGSSIDQFVADELSMSSLLLGAVSRDGGQLNAETGVLSRNAAGWRAPENDIVKVYDSLFGDLGGPVDPSPGGDNKTFRNMALDLTIGEVTELRKAVAGLTQEETKLSGHLAALENIKARGGGLGPGQGESCLAAPPVIHLDEWRAAKASFSSNDGTEYWQDGSLNWRPSDADKKTNFTKLAQSQAELAAYSVLCGHAQVVTVQNAWAASDIPVPQILPSRPTDSYHTQISHVGYNGTLSDPLRRDLATVQGWFVSQVARMCEILSQPDPFDPEHTALDNTIIYVFSEIGDSNLHTKALERNWSGSEDQQIFSYYPAFIVGGGGGALQPGRLITVDNRPMADLLLTLAKAMGSSASSFNGMSTGVIKELLV